MSLFNKISKTFQWGQHTVTMETGEIARQSGGAVMVNIDDTVVLATVVGSKNSKPGQDFFPLTVDYIEKTYAAGKIPGSFFKREAIQRPYRCGPRRLHQWRIRAQPRPDPAQGQRARVGGRRNRSRRADG